MELAGEGLTDRARDKRKPRDGVHPPAARTSTREMAQEELYMSCRNERRGRPGATPVSSVLGHMVTP